MKLAVALRTLAAALVAPAILPAKIDLVTLPSADRTELTIYNSQDLTLVRESRTLSFVSGENRIQFSWSGTLIDPTSLRLTPVADAGLELQETIFPAGTSDLAVWVVTAERPVSASADIAYFTSGVSWSARYEARASADETTLGIRQFTTIRNASGRDFEDAVVRVVVGEVNLVDLIVALARGRFPKERDGNRDWYFSDADVASPFGGTVSRGDLWRVKADEPLSAAREILKKAVSEYTVFAVQGTADIRDGWSQALPNPPAVDVPFDLSYELDPKRYGPLPVKFYKLRNDTAHRLGRDPLPAGTWFVTRDDGRGGVAFEGKSEHKYVPRGEKIELNLGADGMVTVKEKALSRSRSAFAFHPDGSVRGWDEVEDLAIEVRNGRSRAVPFRLTRSWPAGWEFVSVSHPDFERLDRTDARWDLTLPPQGTTTIRCQVRSRRGDDAKSL